MIINEHAGSRGDAMPWYFKRAGVGKLVGTRTWGGLVGMARGPGLMDGGFLGAPSSGIYNPLTGEWEVENIGIPRISRSSKIRPWYARVTTRNWKRLLKSYWKN
jgi:tricorn protease